MSIRGLVLSALVMSMVACADEDPAVLEDLATESEVQLTYNGDLKLLGSYHELFDKSPKTACVQYDDGGKHARVSEPARNLNIEYVQDKEDLARKLQVDTKAKGRYGLVTGNAAVNLMDEYSSSSNTVTFLLSANADYMVRDVAGSERSIILSPKGLAALQKGAANFARTCGTQYATGVRYGARFYLLIKFKATDHYSKTTMDASLGIDGALAGSGDVKTRLETTAKMSGVQVTVKAASSGFWISGKPTTEMVKAMEGGKVDATLFTAASQLYMGMTKAVENDYCLDSGEGTCEGGKASPGYYNRGKRDSGVTGVQLSAYHGLSNAGSAGKGSVWAKLKDRTAAINRFVRAYSEIQTRMDGVYQDEVKPFLDATPQQKAKFNIAPPGKPLRTPTDLIAVAEAVDEQIYPPNGGVMGWMREDVYDRIKACLDKVDVDIMASCTAGDKAVAGVKNKGELEAEETQQWNELYAFFDTYQKTQRILPLQVVEGDSTTSKNAQDECDDLAYSLNKALGQKGSTTKVIYRVPTKDEVPFLAPVLSHGNITWTNADIFHAAWYTPTGANPCGVDYPYYQNQPSGPATFGCSVNDYWDEDLVTLCVPSDGPVPLLAAQ